MGLIRFLQKHNENVQHRRANELKEKELQSIRRQEVRQRWDEKTLQESEERILKMGKKKFDQFQAEGGKIFQTISDNMTKGYDSEVVQAQVVKWGQWLENFHHYSDEAVLGLGQAYSKNLEFAKFHRNIHKDLPEFLTKVIEYYCAHK